MLMTFTDDADDNPMCSGTDDVHVLACVSMLVTTGSHVTTATSTACNHTALHSLTKGQILNNLNISPTHPEQLFMHRAWCITPMHATHAAAMNSFEWHAPCYLDPAKTLLPVTLLNKLCPHQQKMCMGTRWGLFSSVFYQQLYCRKWRCQQCNEDPILVAQFVHATANPGRTQLAGAQDARLRVALNTRSGGHLVVQWCAERRAFPSHEHASGHVNAAVILAAWCGKHVRTSLWQWCKCAICCTRNLQPVEHCQTNQTNPHKLQPHHDEPAQCKQSKHYGFCWCFISRRATTHGQRVAVRKGTPQRW